MLCNLYNTLVSFRSSFLSVFWVCVFMLVYVYVFMNISLYSKHRTPFSLYRLTKSWAIYKILPLRPTNFTSVLFICWTAKSIRCHTLGMTHLLLEPHHSYINLRLMKSPNPKIHSASGNMPWRLWGEAEFATSKYVFLGGYWLF